MKGFKFVNTVLSFVLAIFLFMSASLGALYLSVFNEQKTLGMFVSEEYMSASYDDFMSSMEALATPSYISKECYESVFSRERYFKDLKKFFSETFRTGKRYDLSKDTSDIQEKLYENIEQFGKEKDIEITEAIENNIKDFSNQAVEKYRKYISLSFIQYYSKICSKFEKPLIVALGVCLLFSLVISIILIKSKYYDHCAKDYFSYSFVTAAILTAIYPIYSLSTGLYKKINITPKYVYDIIKALLLNVQNTFFVFSVILFVVGIVFSVTAFFGAYGGKRKDEKNELQTTA